MGKGDRRTRRGKVFRGTFGKVRLRRKKKIRAKSKAKKS